MKFKLCILFLYWAFYGFAQSVPKPKSAVQFSRSKTVKDKIRYSFITAEYYLDNDDIEASQKWLNATKDLLNPAVTDTTDCFVHSLQSELFYYSGLYQFGKDEARKEIVIAKKIKDSLLIADGYLFLAINQIELSDNVNAEKSLWTAAKSIPKKRPLKRLRFIIQNQHIYHNLAQVKIKMNQPNAALWYNLKAYEFAKKAVSRRGIPNAENTFGEIYLSQKKYDSAVFYFKKSISSSLESEYYDIVLINYGFLMECYKDDASVCGDYYSLGLQLMDKRIINSAYKKLFFMKALAVFKNIDDKKTNAIQQEIIGIDTNTQLQNNLYFQNYIDEYIRNEKKLLSFELLKLKRQKDIVIFQLLIAILLLIVLTLAILYVRRKNKINSTLLSQKNEISKDLHDDIGSGISSILIHSDLLQKSQGTDEKQKILLNKISVTAKEVSQRINTFIWSLNAENNTLRDFMEYVKLYAENLFEGTPLELDFIENEKTSEHFLIDGKTRKNLFFSIKEIFNNALKHSNADAITIRVSVIERKNLQIEIKDNGIGISGQNYFGNGLKNIKKRVQEMNGTITIESENGLSTKIFIPLPE